MTVALDSWAVLRWLEGIDPAAGIVDDAVARGAVMSWVNLGEVFYVTWRASGEATAREIVSALRGLIDLDEATPERVLSAAAIKAEHAMALGDAFAAATAIAYDVPLLTGDPELIGRDGPWTVRDLR